MIDTFDPELDQQFDEKKYPPVMPPAPIADAPVGPLPQGGTMSPVDSAALGQTPQPSFAPVSTPPLQAPTREQAQYQAVVPHGWRKALAIAGLGMTAFGEGPQAAQQEYENLWGKPREQAEQRYKTDLGQYNTQQ